MVTGQQLAEWLSRLVQIPSVSPEQAGPRAGVPGEARLAAEVTRWFQAFGGEVHRHEVLPERPNIYGLWRGRSDRWLAVDVHMDTVGVEQMLGNPFSGLIQAGRVYGRGAVDTKASLAVVLALLEAMHQAGQAPPTNLLIAATMDEEMRGQGALAFAEWVRQQGLPLDQLAVAEPTLCGPVYGHKGALRMGFEVQGKSTHSSQPELGQNAITAAARLILALDEEHQRLQSLSPSPWKGEGRGEGLGPPTLTVTIIHGGIGENVVPESCQLFIDRRIVDGEKSLDVAAALQELAQQACPLPVKTTTGLAVEAFLQPPDTPWLRQLAAWSGRAPAVVPYGTNASAYGGLARECVVIGPGSIDQAHGSEEWVTIAELEKMAGIYAKWWGLQF
ncbi:MAG: acetylornithine deacetylase [Chloroflexota bacterium]|nr:MAG: acetylornithine deacetylase [Chloroflexota bacterium]